MEQDLHDELISIHKKLDELKPLVEANNHVLMGNGQPGVVAQVTKLMQAYTFWRTVASSVSASALVAIFALLLARYIK